jgi:flagellar basal-body rod protein FlgB
MAALNLNSYFGLDTKALAASEERASVIANNLANANTPNYQAQDIDFSDYLNASMSGSAQQLQVSSPNHIGAHSNFSTTLKNRPVDHVSLDGNTVNKDIETTEFAKNSLNYQASLNFLNNKIRYMTMALRGE